jgi:hypothetical protein
VVIITEAVALSKNKSKVLLRQKRAQALQNRAESSRAPAPLMPTYHRLEFTTLRTVWSFQGKTLTVSWKRPINCGRDSNSTWEEAEVLLGIRLHIYQGRSCSQVYPIRGQRFYPAAAQAAGLPRTVLQASWKRVSGLSGKRLQITSLGKVCRTYWE